MTIQFFGYAATYIHFDTSDEIIAVFSIRRTRPNARRAFDTLNHAREIEGKTPLKFGRIIPVVVSEGMANGTRNE